MSQPKNLYHLTWQLRLLKISKKVGTLVKQKNDRKFLKAAWINEGYHQTIKDLIQASRLSHNSFIDFAINLQPFTGCLHLKSMGDPCIWHLSAEFTKNRFDITVVVRPIDFQDFFAHLMRLYSSRLTTIQEAITAHKSLCQEAVSLLGRIERGEAKRPNGLAWRDPGAYNLNATYHGIIIMMDQCLEPDFEPDLGELLYLHE
jgi:hypothetical protein